MQLVKTVQCKLDTTPEQLEALQTTFASFSGACNYALKVSRENRTTNKVRLQHLCYHDLKNKFGLTANLAIRAIARVAEASKKRKARYFKADSISYDHRIFSYIPEKEMVSLSTVSGRLKIPLKLGNYQRHLLEGQNPTSATVVYHKAKRHKGFYINIVLSNPVPTPKGSNPVGVDLGINNIATTSNGFRYPGGEAKHIRRRYANLRSSLQSKGTRGARRLLKRLSGKESRIIRNINHVISRRIVESLNQGDVLVLEDLKHIRDRTKVRKDQRYIHESWPFGELQSFIEYKALEAGIPVIYVDPGDSSHTCPRCGRRGSRNGHWFFCSCGYRNHADFSASYEISNRGRALLEGLASCSPEATPAVAVASPAL